MTNQTQTALAPYNMLPSGFLMWASMYTALFYVCGGMLAAMYSAD